MDERFRGAHVIKTALCKEATDPLKLHCVHSVPYCTVEVMDISIIGDKSGYT